jgi:hypothetical protein
VGADVASGAAASLLPLALSKARYNEPVTGVTVARQKVVPFSSDRHNARAQRKNGSLPNRCGPDRGGGGDAVDDGEDDPTVKRGEGS